MALALPTHFVAGLDPRIRYPFHTAMQGSGRLVSMESLAFNSWKRSILWAFPLERPGDCGKMGRRPQVLGSEQTVKWGLPGQGVLACGLEGLLLGTEVSIRLVKTS